MPLRACVPALMSASLWTASASLKSALVPSALVRPSSLLVRLTAEPITVKSVASGSVDVPVVDLAKVATEAGLRSTPRRSATCDIVVASLVTLIIARVTSFGAARFEAEDHEHRVADELQDLTAVVTRPLSDDLKSSFITETISASPRDSRGR